MTKLLLVKLSAMLFLLSFTLGSSLDEALGIVIGLCKDEDEDDEQKKFTLSDFEDQTATWEVDEDKNFKLTGGVFQVTDGLKRLRNKTKAIWSGSVNDTTNKVKLELVRISDQEVKNEFTCDYEDTQVDNGSNKSNDDIVVINGTGRLVI